MKPIYVRFRCFGPYLEEQFIDFTQLEQNGLFLICGETGAGKTTILDAMCYALYGRSSGGLRGDLSVMRCKLAEKTMETLVEFVFDCGGQRYKFVRSLKYARKNLNDYHNCMQEQDGEFVPLLSNPKDKSVSAMAQTIIGLTYHQFRQVIILPQGQFEELLVSNSVKKEEILVTLFHADRWQRLVDELTRRVAERDLALKQEYSRIQEKLRDHGCATLEALDERISTAEAAVQALSQQTEESAGALAAIKKRWELALSESQAFEELRRREQRVALLLPQCAKYDAEAPLLDLADNSEKIRPVHLEWQETLRQKRLAQRRQEQAQKQLDAAALALSQALARQLELEAQRPRQEARQQRLARLESARPLYQSLSEKNSILLHARKECGAAKRKLDQAQKRFTAAHDQWLEALDAQAQAIEDYKAAQARYLHSIGGILAQRLVPGEACPVCGSTQHPNPAVSTSGHITEAELDARNQAMNLANDRVSHTLSLRTQAEEEKNQAAAAHHEAAQKEAAAKAECDSAQRQKIDDIHDPAQLEAQIRALRAQIDAFQKADAEIATGVSNARGEEKAAQTECASAKEAWDTASQAADTQEALWMAALTDSGLENEAQFLAASLEPKEKQRRRMALLQFYGDLSNAQTALSQQQALLEGRSAPDMKALRGQTEEAERHCQDLREKLLLATRALSELRECAGELSRRTAAHRTARIAADEDLEFVNRLRGRSGVSLQRYVLSVMLTSITVEANRLLKNVYGGRYQLYRTNEIAGSGHKGGLELEISDAFSGQRRSVTTLSGGEKFLVALSLAIGLSTVVQAQGSGIRLEAMFIDEGFGSLDREAVNDALEILQGVQRGTGIVGIISHVEQLAESIPQKIEIVKGRTGSRCVPRR